ncbi:MAG: hypothetical protein E3J81_08850 [Dehalococcoidia bacterium]|nr:MAG: hypothetical protein E3J81_08850 [Dehalococcoidia bacterium]
MRQTVKEPTLEAMLTTHQAADFLQVSLKTDTKDREVPICPAETNLLFHVRKQDIEKKQVHAE